MPRSKKPVPENLVKEITHYLLNLFANPERVSHSLSRTSNLPETEKELHHLQTLTGPDQVMGLQVWVDTWLNAQGRKRMWSALRQQRHKEKHTPNTVTLSAPAHEKLQRYAKRHHLTFSNAILQGLEEEVEKKEEGESLKEFKIKPHLAGFIQSSFRDAAKKKSGGITARERLLLVLGDIQGTIKYDREKWSLQEKKFLEHLVKSLKLILEKPEASGKYPLRKR